MDRNHVTQACCHLSQTGVNLIEGFVLPSPFFILFLSAFDVHSYDIE